MTINTFRIYDRWGNLVHNEEGVINGWDGSFANDKSESGVYIYHVIFTREGQEEFRVGDITLIR